MLSNHSIDVSRTISPTVANQSVHKDVSKPTQKGSSTGIKHRYYVDTSDIIYMLKSTAKILQNCSLETF